MSKGVVIVAFDSDTDQNNTLKYTELAKISAAQVRRHLKLPVAIVTDKPVDGFDDVLIVDKPDSTIRHVQINKHHENYNWFNDYRRQLFYLTPYEQTLLIDADYFVQSDSFLRCFEYNDDFQIIGNVYDPTGRNSFDKYRLLPNRTIPQLWATAMYWNRNAGSYFEYANNIADNYDYYAKVFEFSPAQYRNDMVFSIVGHMLPTSIMPWKMWMTGSDCKLVDANERGLKFEFDNSVVRVNNDVHVLSKHLLFEDNLNLLKQWSSV